MDALECLATRRSIRRFMQVPIDQETILTIVEAGTRAPSAGNIQDWRFVVVDDKNVKRQIADACLGQECVHNAATVVVVCSEPQKTVRHYGLRGEKLYTVQDCAAASENMLLAAHALGLGGVWVGSFDDSKLRNILNIPESIRPQSVLAFGYPAEVPDPKLYKEISFMVFFNSYGSKVKNAHRLMQDYSIEWEKQINKGKTAIQRIKEKMIESSAAKKENIQKKSKSFMERYKESIEKLKKKKQ